MSRQLSFCVIGILLMALSGATGWGAANLVEHSSFEYWDGPNDPVGWSAGANKTVVSADKEVALNGNASAHFVFDGQKVNMGQEVFFKLTPGKAYTLSAYVKSKDLVSAKTLQLQVINLGWSFGYQSRVTFLDGTKDWYRVHKTFVCPPADKHKYKGNPNTLYKVMLYAAGVRGELWLDGIQVEEGKTPTGYMPKETADAKADATGPSPNLLFNSSFENILENGQPQGWSSGKDETGYSLQPGMPKGGKICVHYTLNGKTATFGQRQYIKLEPGKTYTFSAYVKTKDLSDNGALQLQVVNLGWSFHHQTRLALPRGTTTWKRYSRTFVCPPANQFQYRKLDNVQYKPTFYTKDVTGEIWIDALQLEEGDRATLYRPHASEKATYDDIVAETVFRNSKNAGRGSSRYFQVEKPLFKELLTDQPGPRRMLYYGYEDLYPDVVYRLYAKKFGFRFVLEEQAAALKAAPLIPMTNAWQRGGVGSYQTMRMIARPSTPTKAPKVLGKLAWILDPRYEETFLAQTEWLSKKSLDMSPDNVWGNSWGLWLGDEVYESAGIKVVPPEKRDAVIWGLEKEIKEKFGFGKYGMPKSWEDPDLFTRIAYRRWVNYRLTELFKKVRKSMKQINPKLTLLGPDPCGCVPAVDLEAMTPHMDLVSSQAWYSPKSFAWQLACGADTKAMADLSECPVWTLVQHFSADTPEEVREQFSQVYRNGGEGIVLLSVEWWDRELDHTQFANPPKWRAMMEILDTITKMNKVRLPEPDTAVLYASDTLLAKEHVKMAYTDYPQMYAAYAVLGPSMGTWFSFVSDRQIDRDVRKLSDYKALYVPYAQYERGAVLKKIEAYALDGGIVVCTDPRAFTWDINGESSAARWEQIAGVRRGAPRKGEKQARVSAHDLIGLPTELKINFPEPGLVLTAANDATKTLAVFPDGTTAITLRRYGKGYVIQFAADPFASEDRNTPVIKFVRAVQKFAGAKLEQDIWRFKLPPFKTDHTMDPEKRKCLTGNNLKLVRRDVRMVHNLTTGGTYTFDRFPTGFADVATTGDIPFTAGRLTNRQRAYETRSKGARSPAALEKWIVSWTDVAPVKVTFDLKKSYALDRVRVVYGGQLPAMTIQTSEDGKIWRTATNHPAQPVTQDAPDVIVSLAGKARFVRLALAKRDVQAPMELCEVEIWGDE